MKFFKKTLDIFWHRGILYTYQGDTNTQQHNEMVW